MNPRINSTAAALVLLGAGLALAAAPTLAEKPEWAGEGKGQGKGNQKKKYFDDDKRDHVRSYYEEDFRRGHCPPGLAKKHNGCMPPGQAKKWRMGRRKSGAWASRCQTTSWSTRCPADWWSRSAYPPPATNTCASPRTSC